MYNDSCHQLADPYSLSLAALIITHNEEKNIRRTLSAITWIPDVLILDSGSSDATLTIAGEFTNTNVIQRPFDTFANQCNYGLSFLTSEWVLSMDADYVVTKELANEIFLLLTSRNQNPSISGYAIRMIYCVGGKPIRSGLMPPRKCLYRRDSAFYSDEGHGHRVNLTGESGYLKSPILHDDRKPIGVWLQNQKRYQYIEAINLSRTSDSDLPVQDLLRKHTCFAPFAAFFLSFFLRAGFLDGKEGMVYAFQRFIAEAILYLNLYSMITLKSREP